MNVSSETSRSLRMGTAKVSEAPPLAQDERADVVVVGAGSAQRAPEDRRLPRSRRQAAPALRRLHARNCIVHWNLLETCWDCPCHGSHFSIDGEPINGPAIYPLAEV